MALSALRLWLLLVTILFYAFLVVSSQEDPGDGYEWVYEDVEEVLFNAPKCTQILIADQYTLSRELTQLLLVI